MPIKNGFYCSLIITLLILTLGMPIIPHANAASYNVSVNTGTVYQTLEGFGAAVAWGAASLTHHPYREELYPLLFNDLGLDIIRFRNTYRGPNGRGFAEDEGEILKQAAKSLGHPIKVLLCSWSPPAELKFNRIMNGGTLKKGNGGYPYDQFGEYWYNSLKAYAEKGVVPDYISIQNEPDFTSSGWETCVFKEEELANFPAYGKALNAVYQRVKTLPAPPKLIGPETGGIGSFIIQSYCDNLDLSQLYGIAYHLYNGGNANKPDSFIPDMEDIHNAYPDKPIFETEFDQGTPFTTGVLMLNALVSGNVNAYFFWDLIWDPSQRPLVAVENPKNRDSWKNSKGYAVSDFYYVFKQFSKFTDPGFKRVAASADSKDIRTTAFISPDQKKLTVILINQGTAPAAASLNLNGYTAGSSTVYRTVPGGAEKCSKVGALGSGNMVELPAQSITTVVLQK